MRASSQAPAAAILNKRCCAAQRLSRRPGCTPKPLHVFSAANISGDILADVPTTKQMQLCKRQLRAVTVMICIV